jgi:hypothetical protein
MDVMVFSKYRDGDRLCIGLFVAFMIYAANAADLLGHFG